VCTNRDPSGRRRAVDLVGQAGERLFCVGRLDADSEGLLLLTNDGALTQQLTHPRYEVPKTYRAQVRGRIAGDDVEQIRKGIWMAEGRTRSATVELTYRSPQRSVLQITLREGRNRQVRRMLARLGYPVRRLRRIAIGELTAKGLAVGKHRRLRPSEVRYLRSLAGQPARRRKRRSR
jgi:23S rRNA pseudouridine2605 synthase